MPFALSPGVTVVEKDFTSIVPSVATSIGAFAGEFQWGPVLYPVTVSSENVLVQLFGKPHDDTAQSFFTAANFLAYSNNLKVVRVESAGARNAVAERSGPVTSISMFVNGSGYTSTPGVTIAAPDSSNGIQALATATASGGSITGIVPGTAGSGYTAAPIVTVGTSFDTAINVAVALGDQIAHLDNLYTVTLAGTTNHTVVPVHTTGMVVNGTAELTWAGLRAKATAVVTLTAAVINNINDYEQSWSNGGSSTNVFGAFAAKYPGKYGNFIKISMADSTTFASWDYKTSFPSAPGTSASVDRVGGSKDELHIIVLEVQGTKEVVLETYQFVSKASDAKKTDGSNSYYKTVLNNSSKYIWWTGHPESGTNWGTTAANTVYADLSALEDTITLTGGVDDFAASEGNFTAGFDLFLNSEEIDVSLIMMGKASAAVAGYVIANIAEVRKDCVVCISPEDTLTSDPIIGTGSAAATKVIAYHTALIAAGTSSSYAVLDSGYKYQYDRYNDLYRWIPLNGDVAGLCARTDNTNDPWFSPGGMSRGQIKNAIKLSFNPGKTERDTLYNIGINPVVSFPGSGTVLYGDKTLLAKPSAFDRINVRRLFIVLEKSIAIAAKAQLFEFNDSFTRAQFKNLVEPYLRDIEGRRGITDFRVVCDETNNTGEVIDRNEFVADIYIKPARSINYITLNFIAARTGISFEEIGA